jgi:hypothetical protein
MRLAVRSAVVAVCLAIVALAPVAASARPAFDVPRGVAFYPTPTGEVVPMSQSPEVHPNPDQQVVVVHHRTVVPPIPKPVPASKLAGEELASAHAVNDSRATGGYSPATFNGSGHPGSVQAPKSPSANPDNGFDWGDAAIGAAAGLTLTLLVGAAAIAISRRRSLQSDSASVATT